MWLKNTAGVPTVQLVQRKIQLFPVKLLIQTSEMKPGSSIVGYPQITGVSVKGSLWWQTPTCIVRFTPGFPYR